VPENELKVNSDVAEVIVGLTKKIDKNETFNNKVEAVLKVAETLPTPDIDKNEKLTLKDIKVFQEAIEVVNDNFCLRNRR